MPDAHLGDPGIVANLDTGNFTGAIWADNGGTKNQLGEGSVASARKVDVDPSPTSGGTLRRVIGWMVFPGSGIRKFRADYKEAAEALFAAWGGIARLRDLLGWKPPAGATEPVA